MSAGESLLIFLDPFGDVEGWLHLAGGAVCGRGRALDGLPRLDHPETGEPLHIAAIVPGDTVTLHWLELPAGLAPAQAIAAGRLMAADVSAQSIDEMHVAVGREVEGDTARAVALVPALAMAGWLSRLQSHGLDPDLMAPEPLLLPRPDDGFVRYDRGGLPLFRGRNEAFSVEPELAELIVGSGEVRRLGDGAFEAGLAAAISDPAVNLRQGPFAKRRRWKIEWKLVRRLAALALAILFVSLAIQVVNILRYTYAADALQAEANRIAARALPRVSISNAAAQLQRRVTELGGGGASYGSMAAAVFAAVRDTPNVELAGMVFDRTGALRATVQADGPASISAFEARLEATGFDVEAGALRSGGARPVAELTVRPR